MQVFSLVIKNKIRYEIYPNMSKYIVCDGVVGVCVGGVVIREKKKDRERERF